MGSTTLVTFLLETPQSTSTVELLGSWDRFTRAYSLEKDERMGRGYWRGCYTFTDIVYDGDTEELCQRRDGGLKMGGTYWYFYRLDGEIDYCNYTEPSTKLCPLFPGQEVNVLEVPTDAGTVKRIRSNESSSSINSAVFTLDPKHRYLNPRPPTRKPALLDTCASARKDISVQVCAQLLGMVRYGANRTNTSSEEPPQAIPTSSGDANKGRMRLPNLGFKQSSLVAVFHRMRGTKSAEYSRESNTARSCLHSGKATGSMSRTLKPFERGTRSADDGRSTSSRAPSRAKVPARDPLPASHIFPPKTFSKPSTYTTPPDPIPPKLNAPPNTPTPSKYQRSESCMSSLADDEAIPPTTSSNSARCGIVPRELWGPRDSRIYQRSDERKSKVSTDSNPHTRSSKDTSRNLPIAGEYTRDPSLDELTDGVHSPGLGVFTVRSGSSSPCYLSEPDSPLSPDLDQQQITIKDGSVTDGAHEDDDPRPPWHTRMMGGGRYDDTRSLDKTSLQPFFAGYSLPQSEHASALTIKQPQLNPFQTLNSNPFRDSNDRNNIQVLDNSPTFRMTALEELVDDLGYLGQAII